jgi:hypothetical protein
MDADGIWMKHIKCKFVLESLKAGLESLRDGKEVETVNEAERERYCLAESAWEEEHKELSVQVSQLEKEKADVEEEFHAQVKAR